LRVLFLKLCPFRVVGESENTTRRGVAFACIERRKTRCVYCRFRRKLLLEDLVGPSAQLRRRAKVQGQWHDTSDCGVAEALPDDVVDVDISSSEAVDGLLRVTYDEQRARPQRNLPPVGRILLFPRERCRTILGQPEQDLRLQRVGVLKFINEEVSELLLQGSPHRFVPTQHARSQIEKVTIVQGVETAALSCRRFACLIQQRHRQLIHIMTPLRQVRTDDCRVEGLV